MLRYAEPLLAERAYIADQALAVEVRRSAGGATLRQAAAAALGVDVASDAITWDALRRDDGQWVVCATYADRGSVRTAEWTYDHAGRNIHPLDDNARSLMGVRAHVDDRDAIADALDLVAEPEPLPDPVDARPRLVAVPDAVDEPATDEPDDAEEPADDEPDPVTATSQTVTIPHPSSTAAEPTTPAAKAPAGKPKAKPRKGRASVPSWDEILFGATRPDDQP